MKAHGFSAISTLALSTVAGAESDTAPQLAEDAPGAYATTLADQAEYDAQHASDPSPSRLDGLAAQGVPLVDFVLGVTRAQDHATATAECVSLDESAEYELLESISQGPGYSTSFLSVASRTL